MTKVSWSAVRACRRTLLPAAASLLVAALVAAGSAPARAAPPPTASRPATDPQPASPPVEGDTASRSVAARARTNECGHQWNNMKRAGTAAGTTWKEFFRVCQAQK